MKNKKTVPLVVWAISIAF